jgi:hypothetical protein
MALTKIITDLIEDQAVHSSKIADGAVHGSKIANGAVGHTKMANDAIGISNVGTEFKTLASLTPSSVIDVPFGTSNGAAVFTLTLNSNSTLNLVDVSPGINKHIVITGSGGGRTINFTVGGGAGTFNKISGAYNDASGIKNLIQILCVGNSEFWYSISQIDT